MTSKKKPPKPRWTSWSDASIAVLATLKRYGKDIEVRFARGNKIFVLPDPDYLDKTSRDVPITELPDSLWWCAVITGCCSIKSDGEPNPLGILRVEVSGGVLRRVTLSSNAKQAYEASLQRCGFVRRSCPVNV